MAKRLSFSSVLVVLVATRIVMDLAIHGHAGRRFQRPERSACMLMASRKGLKAFQRCRHHEALRVGLLLMACHDVAFQELRFERRSTLFSTHGGSHACISHVWGI